MSGPAPDEPSWCSFRPDEYEKLLEEHVRGVRDNFSEFLGGGKPLDVYPSPREAFRLRVKFLIYGNVGEDGDSENEEDVPEGTEPIKYAGWHEGKRHPVDEYRIASHTIQEKMPDVLAYISNNRPLRYNLRGLQYLSTMSGDLLLTMIYEKRRLSEVWQRNANKMRSDLGIDLIAQTKGVLRLIGGRQHVNEELKGPSGEPLYYKQIAGNFSNPNGYMAMHTLTWLQMCCVDIKAENTDLLELYCGVGSHTVAMAKYFRRVLGVEINRKLVEAAHCNLRLNSATNAWVMRAPSEKFCSSMLRHSTWKLDVNKYQADSSDPEHLPFMKEQDKLLNETETDSHTAEFTFGAVIVDPPRAGLDEVTCSLVSRYPSIAYISCNPVALRRDLEALSATHYVSRMAVFDHFPYTGHLECGALLRKK
eukprot:TRINITY_DN24296_c0_g1_i1.p1 TRINITY_DN24296_c0_g1~~TRINITY_DN24296_c0_g1_i1.p1  ORF type:complete len:420 (+),score=66.10 TRINITY_DN24296_c0_g1_i1:55-1314(+)